MPTIKNKCKLTPFWCKLTLTFLLNQRETNVSNANNRWHFNIYEQDKFRAQLRGAWKKFYNLGGQTEKVKFDFVNALKLHYHHLLNSDK